MPALQDLSENAHSMFKCYRAAAKCDFWRTAKHLKKDNRGNPCNASAIIRLLIASGTHEKQNTLWPFGKHATLKCQHCQTTARMHILYSSAVVGTRRECQCCWMQAKRMKNIKYKQTCKTTAKTRRWVASETFKKQNARWQFSNYAILECYQCETTAIIHIRI